MTTHTTRARAGAGRLTIVLAALAAVLVVVLAASPAESSRTAHGPLPRTGAADVVEDLLPGGPFPWAAAVATDIAVPAAAPPAPPAPPPPADAGETLFTPEDVPDPSVRRAITVIGRIQIPAIGLDAELRDQITQESIDLGPSHWPGTAAPGGFGNAVVAGHRASHSAPFRDLDALHAGDEIALVDQHGRRFAYAVTDIFVVYPDAMWITDQSPGRTLTLFTCHPVGSAAQRLVVRATLARTGASAGAPTG